VTAAAADFFRNIGNLRLEGFHDAKRIAAIRQRVLDELDRLSKARSLSNRLRGLPVFQQIGKLSTLVKVPGLNQALMTPELLDRVAQLGGRAPAAFQDTGLLLSPPNQGHWSLDGLNWHVDVAASARDRPPGIQAFFLIDRVAPRGGATLALAGSHHLGPRQTSASRLREVLKTPDGLQHKLHELGVAMVEMSGRAGDVYLMDMRLLHTPSINATRSMRMMATCRCLLEP
jgi:hypothetical protein